MCNGHLKVTTLNSRKKVKVPNSFPANKQPSFSSARLQELDFLAFSIHFQATHSCGQPRKPLIFVFCCLQFKTVRKLWANRQPVVKQSSGSRLQVLSIIAQPIRLKAFSVVLSHLLTKNFKTLLSAQLVKYVSLMNKRHYHSIIFQKRCSIFYHK